MDKQSLSYASVFGLIDDLNLKGTQYSWCSSIFYIGQLVSEYPFIYLMSKLPLAKFVGVTIIIWGGICMCLSAAHNYAGFAAVRFLLGLSEGAVSPAFVSITSIWYRKSEHPMRIGMWVTMNGLAQVIGSLLMYGIGKNSTLSLAPWRVLFLICGSLTSFCGILFYILIPSVPEKAWFLNQREKEVLMLRMAKDREGGDKTHFSVDQLKEALTDAKAWLVFWFGVLVTMQSPVLTFASLVINNIGYNKFETMLYTSPSGAVQIVFIWIGVLGCFLMPNKRCLVVIFLIIPPFVGNILLLRLPISAGWGLIVASWLSSIISDIMSVLLSLSASNVKGNTKRAIVNTFFFIGYCAGCIGGPQLWTVKPRYFEGVVTAIVTWLLLLIATAAYWYLCARDNRLRDIAEQETTSVPTVEKGQDITDKEDPSFRYSC
ncbi:major facilitator superfamily domain-containing protein [Paecilomyces variotii]|uniref:Major facilitator superfamily domain-containing protein n=1 Tax=Byssochlamys spectabilis TaxID=264951 RepID=A0A443HQN2_BYSSP|nr:major facilitator superfamily domain-containing protein [Paecilomyces variotii]RWQ94080.1 major facilitator superfamily domain-containing protein [Paecilomyces variotii]